MKKTILVVEDDRNISRALTIRLKASGYEVVATFVVLMAGSLASKHSPDLVVLDISMPGGMGLCSLSGCRIGKCMLRKTKKPKQRIFHL